MEQKILENILMEKMRLFFVWNDFVARLFKCELRQKKNEQKSVLV